MLQELIKEEIICGNKVFQPMTAQLVNVDCHAVLLLVEKDVERWNCHACLRQYIETPKGN